MNATNRALNRTMVLLIGIVVLVVGGAVATAAAWPAAGSVWATGGASVIDALVVARDATVIGGSTVSWLGVGVVAALVVLIALLVRVLFSIGGRRSRTVLRSTGSETPLGRVTVTESFVSEAITASLAQRDEVLGSSVTANTIDDEPVLHVSITARQNTDPRDLVELVDRLVSGLGRVTGRETPTYISVHSGLRARLAHDQRRVA
ncbi:MULTISPECIES: hypothetical protein [unclassified Microbacterium]|uniref:hypothetical protein n=1 Tax=unclassified Microbacterium TaxID=2609290 RepID=UPI00386DCE3F